jgi:hypothetical protein
MRPMRGLCALRVLVQSPGPEPETEIDGSVRPGPHFGTSLALNLLIDIRTDLRQKKSKSLSEGLKSSVAKIPDSP